MRDETHRSCWALGIAVSLAPCGVEIPDATFACVTDGDCPCGMCGTQPTTRSCDMHLGRMDRDGRG